MGQNVTFQVEDYLDVIPEMSELYPEHWEEVALDKDAIPLDPDYERYAAMAKAGVLHVVTARDAGKLVGYHISMVYPHLHYRTSLTAYSDIFFVRKAWRPVAGFKLMRVMVDTLKARGVQRIYMGHKEHINLEPIMRRLKFKLIERLYTLTFR